MFLKIKDIKVENRTRQDLGDIKSLSASIKKHGLLQPIGVRMLADGVYSLIFGERRLESHKLLGLEEIDCKVFESIEDAKVYEMELTENKDRKGFNDVELLAHEQKKMQIETARKIIEEDLKKPKEERKSGREIQKITGLGSNHTVEKIKREIEHSAQSTEKFLSIGYGAKRKHMSINTEAARLLKGNTARNIGEAIPNDELGEALKKDCVDKFTLTVEGLQEAEEYINKRIVEYMGAEKKKVGRPPKEDTTTVEEKQELQRLEKIGAEAYEEKPACVENLDQVLTDSLVDSMKDIIKRLPTLEDVKQADRILAKFTKDLVYMTSMLDGKYSTLGGKK